MGKKDQVADDDRDDDDDRPRKKKSKKKAKGDSNTMMFALVGGGVAVVLLLCVCGGIGTAGWQFGWFGGSDKKPIAKANADKDKEKDADQGPPKGVGPLVTDANFDKAARAGRTLAEVEQIMGPGQPLKGTYAEKAKTSQLYNSIRELRPDADAYQWSNDRSVYFIFFNDGVYSAHGGEMKPGQLKELPLPKLKELPAPKKGKGAPR